MTERRWNIGLLAMAALSLLLAFGTVLWSVRRDDMRLLRDERLEADKTMFQQMILINKRVERVEQRVKALEERP